MTHCGILDPTSRPIGDGVTKIYRAVVRGHFSNLDDSTRTALLEQAADHSYLRSAFTAHGTFTYDEQLVAFNLRYELRFEADAPHVDDAAVESQALKRAAEWLTGAGYGHRRLRATVTDMATVWGR